MKKRRKKQSTKKSYTCRISGLIMAITVIAIWGGVLLKRSITESPEDTLVEYMNHIEKKEYEAMYAMIDSGEKGYLEKSNYPAILIYIPVSSSSVPPYCQIVLFRQLYYMMFHTKA